MLATGLSGYAYPIMYSVIMFRPGAYKIKTETLFNDHNRFVKPSYKPVKLSSNLVGSGHDHTNERSEEDSYQTSQESSPPWKLNLCLIVNTYEDNNCKIHGKNRKKPPERNFFITPLHDLCMYIHFLVFTKRSFGLSPKIFAVEKQHMDNTSSQGRKTESIGHGKESAHVDWSCLCVSLMIEAEIGINDARYIVFFPTGYKEFTGVDWIGFGVVEI